MRVVFALLALAATTISANDVIKVEEPLNIVNANYTHWRTTAQTTDTPVVTDQNGNYQADENVALVFNLFGFGALHPFGFASAPDAAVSDFGAMASADCIQAKDAQDPTKSIFAWYPNTTTVTTCTVTLPGKVNGTELVYRCAIHPAMVGGIRFSTPTAVDASSAQGSTGLNPSPIDSTGAAGSSTGGATPVPTPTPTPKPGAAAAQISGVVGLAVAVISALFL